MNIYCDDGSTNVKLAWFEGDELQTRVSANLPAWLKVAD